MGESTTSAVVLGAGMAGLLAASQNTTHRRLAEKPMGTLFDRHSGDTHA